MNKRLGPHQKELVKKMLDGARLYRVADGWYLEYRGMRTKVNRERCMGMYTRGLLVLDRTDELSDGSCRDRYVLSEEAKNYVPQVAGAFATGRSLAGGRASKLAVTFHRSTARASGGIGGVDSTAHTADRGITRRSVSICGLNRK